MSISRENVWPLTPLIYLWDTNFACYTRDTQLTDYLLNSLHLTRSSQLFSYSLGIVYNIFSIYHTVNKT